ncbi:MAG: alpha-xylosidase, partial [Paenibacillaceae bacterium]|nr:alpha-xylosidase [Paenibacillaceae bacterium]
NTAPVHVFKRWLAFGLLSSHSRLHGSSSYRVPWAYDDEAVDVTRFFTKLKCRLMPYMFDIAVQATQQGVPTMRAMFLEFPQDPACDTLDRQYMLGDSLLVAPVFSEQGDVSYYLPEGQWTHLLSGQTVEGGKWRKETYDFFSLPLFVRPNSILATGANDVRPDYDYADSVELGMYAIEDGATVSRTVRNAKGDAELNVTVVRSGKLVKVTAEGAGKPFFVTLHSMGEAAAVQGAVLASNGAVEVASFSGKTELQITLK